MILSLNKMSNKIDITIKPNSNIDGTIFEIDYILLRPLSLINEIKKRVYINNNQKLVVKAKR